MEFQLGPALVAGFVATLAMSATISMSRRMGMTQMPAFELITGSMVSGDERSARRIGLFVHYIMMGTILFGIGYAVVFSALDSASAVTGLVIGAIHGVVVGVVFMPMMPMMHPRIGSSPAGAVPGQLHLTAPGIMGKNWGSMTPMGVIAGHIVYGVVAALVYSSLV